MEDVIERPKMGSRIWRHFQQDLTESWGDAILIVTCIVTGLLDSAVFNVWSCFVSMQTGELGEFSASQLAHWDQETLCMSDWVSQANRNRSRIDG
jgi:hypothetical protein